MNEQTAKLIQDLADKLGTTAEHLWGLLVRQAPISASITLALIIATGVAAYIAIRSAITFSKKYEDDNDYEAATAICTVVAGFLGFLFVITLCLEADLVAAGFFNPEYWALKQVLK